MTHAPSKGRAALLPQDGGQGSAGLLCTSTREQDASVLYVQDVLVQGTVGEGWLSSLHLLGWRETPEERQEARAQGETKLQRIREDYTGELCGCSCQGRYWCS